MVDHVVVPVVLGDSLLDGSHVLLHDVNQHCPSLGAKVTTRRHAAGEAVGESARLFTRAEACLKSADGLAIAVGFVVRDSLVVLSQTSHVVLLDLDSEQPDSLKDCS